MTSQQLYDTIKMMYPLSEVSSICYADQVCLRNGFCAHSQSAKVINFDSVKDDFCNGQSEKPSSVDVICVSRTDKVFYFVELKGWKKYIENVSKQKHTPKDTVEGYKLSKKLSDSLEICRQLASNKELFSDIPIRFLLVTDIETKTHGIESFHSLLNQLGETSSNICLECLRMARKTLDLEIGIDRDYISCQDFDKFIQSN